MFKKNPVLREATVVAAVAMATDIAQKSPVAVQTTKRALVHAREHTVAEGLEFIVRHFFPPF